MSGSENVTVKVPRIFFAGFVRGVGTSTVMLGLAVALRRAGLGVATGFIGNSLIETTHLRRITSRLSLSLDPWALGSNGMERSIIRLCTGTDLVCIEGQVGLFDAIRTAEERVTSSEIATRFGTPIVMIVDVRGMEEGLAALMHGFSTYKPNIKIHGIIANRVKDQQHNKRLASIIESIGGIQYLGGIPEFSPEVQRQLQEEAARSNPSLITRSTMLTLGTAVGEAIDLKKLQSLAAMASPLMAPKKWLDTMDRKVRIAVADDAAFHLMVQDNLDLARRAGADLVACSPLADQVLPRDIGGIYLPGGYVDQYAKDLEQNKSFRTALADFAERGGVIYAEGDALAYLCKSVTLNQDSSYQMVGIIPGVASRIEEKAVSESCTARSVERTILGSTSLCLSGYRERRWFVRLEKKIPTSLQLRDSIFNADAAPISDGFMPTPHSLVASAAFHWGSQAQVAENFVSACMAAREVFRAKKREEIENRQ